MATCCPCLSDCSFVSSQKKKDTLQSQIVQGCNLSKEKLMCRYLVWYRGRMRYLPIGLTSKYSTQLSEELYMA